jgi:hypothetical protein
MSTAEFAPAFGAVTNESPISTTYLDFAVLLTWRGVSLKIAGFLVNIGGYGGVCWRC